MRFALFVLVLWLAGCRASDNAATQLQECWGNCNNIAAAQQTYSNDHDGHYPISLSQLTPNYLKTIPECPVATSDTYSASYRASNSSDGEDAQDQYQFFCKGQHHRPAGLEANRPGATNWQRVVESGELLFYPPGQTP